MSFSLAPVHPVFAAEVQGLAVAREVPPDAVDFLEDAMAHYAVVMLPFKRDMRRTTVDEYAPS
jgi:hypothetical protein